MPHIQIEYSANLDPLVDMSGFCEALRQAAAQVESFPLAGLRVRALRADHYAIANGDARAGFVDISVRLRAGRPETVKQDATRQIFEAARDYLAKAMAQHPIALSLELRDIDPDYAPKTGTIRQQLGLTT